MNALRQYGVPHPIAVYDEQNGSVGLGPQTAQALYNAVQEVKKQSSSGRAE